MKQNFKSPKFVQGYINLTLRSHLKETKSNGKNTPLLHYHITDVYIRSEVVLSVVLLNSTVTSCTNN